MANPSPELPKSPIDKFMGLLLKALEEVKAFDTPRSTESRHLDRLARLLEGDTVCTAVFPYHDKLYLAGNFKSHGEVTSLRQRHASIVDYLKRRTNECPTHWRENRDRDRLSLMEELLLDSIEIRLGKYLKEKNSDTRNKYFKDMIGFIYDLYCKDREDGILSEFVIVEQLRSKRDLNETEKVRLKNVEESVYQKLEERTHAFQTTNNLKFSKKQEEKEKLLNGLLYLVLRTLNDIKKVESSCRDTLLNRSLSIVDEDLRTGFGIHAEMRILAFMVKNKYLDKLRYIGISRKCCSHCHLVLSRISKLNIDWGIPDYGIIPEYSGAHGKHFHWPVHPELHGYLLEIFGQELREAQVNYSTPESVQVIMNAMFCGKSLHLPQPPTLALLSTLASKSQHAEMSSIAPISRKSCWMCNHR